MVHHAAHAAVHFGLFVAGAAVGAVAAFFAGDHLGRGGNNNNNNKKKNDDGGGDCNERKMDDDDEQTRERSSGQSWGKTAIDVVHMAATVAAFTNKTAGWCD
jgi:gas vesicle protein